MRKLASEGLSRAAVAERVGRSETTVRKHTLDAAKARVRQAERLERLFRACNRAVGLEAL